MSNISKMELQDLVIRGRNFITQADDMLDVNHDTPGLSEELSMMLAFGASLMSKLVDAIERIEEQK